MKINNNRLEEMLEKKGMTRYMLSKQMAALTGLKESAQYWHIKGACQLTEDDITAMSAVLDISEAEVVALTDSSNDSVPRGGYMAAPNVKALEQAIGHMSRTSLAKKIGISTTTISKCLEGRKVKIETAELISAALGRDPESLFNFPAGARPGKDPVPKAKTRPVPVLRQEPSQDMDEGKTEEKTKEAAHEFKSVDGMQDVFEIFSTINSNLGVLFESQQAVCKAASAPGPESSKEMRAIVAEMRLLAEAQAGPQAASGTPEQPKELDKYSYNEDDSSEKYKTKVDTLVRKISCMTGLIPNQILHDSYVYMKRLYGVDINELQRKHRSSGSSIKECNIGLISKEKTTARIYLNTLVTWASNPPEAYFRGRYKACARLPLPHLAERAGA